MNKGANKKVMKIVGAVLKSQRWHLRRKITQETMARLLGISQEQYCRIEQGKGRLSIIELLIICDCLGITLTELVFKIEDRLMAESLLSPKLDEKFRQWLEVYQKVYKIIR